MDLGLKGKTIFVAGASRGIGLGIVEACLAEGAKVAITARGAEALETTRQDLAARYGAENLWAMAGDLRDTATIEKALAGTEEALGPIHGAVANVGLHPGPRSMTRPGTPAFRRTSALHGAWRAARTVGWSPAARARSCSSAPSPAWARSARR